MNKNNVEVQVLSNGKPLTQYGHNGRTYIEAKIGRDYEIRIRNSNSYRIEAVISVDGIDAVSGKPASYDEGGYIVGAFSSGVIKGYRKSLNEVGTFRFTRKEKSYAAGVTGSTGNVGIIAVAVFREKEKPAPTPTYIPYPVYVERPKPYWQERPWYYDYTHYSTTGGILRGMSCSASASASSGGTVSACNNTETRTFNNVNLADNISIGNCSSSCGATTTDSAQSATFCSAQAAEAPSFTVGSTWGKKLEDRVVSEEFIRESNNPLAVFELFYDTAQELTSLGIDLRKTTKVVLPQGFPNQFAKPPANWTE